MRLSGLQSQLTHAGGETARLPLLGGQGGSPPSVGRTGAQSARHGGVEGAAQLRWGASGGGSAPARVL